MMLKTVEYRSLPADAMDIRSSVFEIEQGFTDEYDDIDHIATHLVMYDGGCAIACCRYFPAEKDGHYYLGRMAVIPKYRGKHIGKRLMEDAEASIRAVGGVRCLLHAQTQASGFYKKSGYSPIAEEDFEQGCPHIWMAKSLI